MKTIHYIAALTTLIGATSCVELQGKATESEDDVFPDATGGLFLSPLIEANKTQNAREKSKVKLFKECCDVEEAYSGYITVNETARSHLFFLHVKAQQENREILPLILWLDGGPGQSSLLGELLSNGPVGISSNGSLLKRMHHITNFSNVIYLDEPVGAGFSYTENPGGYAKSMEDVADDIHEFLRQFVQLFPEYENREFYVAGESFGARAAAATAIKFHKDSAASKRATPALSGENRRDSVKLNFSGVSCGVPFICPMYKLFDYTDYLYHVGLIDQIGRRVFTDVFGNLTDAFENNKPLKVAYIVSDVLWEARDMPEKPSVFTQLTGYKYSGNALQAVKPPERIRYDALMKNATFKTAIHVGGNVTFRGREPIINVNLAQGLLRDISDEIITLLNNYKVLIYVGGLDLMIPATNVETFVRGLNWTGQVGFNKARRVPWGLGDLDPVTGYLTEVGRFWFVHLLRGGHYPFLDQRQAAVSMMQGFVQDRHLTRHC